VVGGAVTNGADLNPPPQTGCGTQIDPATYQLDTTEYVRICNQEGAGHISGGVATPGTYSSISWTGGGTLKLSRGVYCLTSNNSALKLNGGVVTTDWDGDGIGVAGRDDTEGVLFYIPNGSVDIGGNTELHISAMEGPSTLDIRVKGYLIVLPDTNHSTVGVQGGGNSQVVGSIIAPGSLVTLEGNACSGSGCDPSATAFNLQSQVVGYSIKVSGSGQLNINYNDALVGKTYTNPLLTPYK
jgi:hypothetical protein